MDNKNFEKLVTEAEKAMNNAYAPYSNFRVGAAIMAADGRIFTGCNVENSSFGLSICAERSAVFNAVLNGCKKFVALAVFTDTEEVTEPCGACRQVLSEFCDDLDIILSTPYKQKTEKLSDIFPSGFLLKK